MAPDRWIKNPAAEPDPREPFEVERFKGGVE